MATLIPDLLAQITQTPGCRVIPATEPVDIRTFELTGSVSLPADLREYLTLANGLELYVDSNYPLFVHGLSQLLRANPVIVGEDCAEDRSYQWFLIANDGSDEYLTIDLSTERSGRCYDSFFDRHGIPGSCPVIASSFTDLLVRALSNKGEHWWWLQREFPSLGDAYDS